MAVASPVDAFTVTAEVLGWDSETVNDALTVPAWPSVTGVASAMEIDGGASSLTMVPTAWVSEIVAPDGLDRFRVND